MEPIVGTTIIQRPQRHFTYFNGDQYFGEYGVDVNAKQIFRHGCGSYVTSKCTIYQGKWTFDKLLDHVNIRYPNKHTFCGSLDFEGNYQSGAYDFGDSCKVCGSFQEPANLEFHDPNNTVWKAELMGCNLSVSNEGDV